MLKHHSVCIITTLSTEMLWSLELTSLDPFISSVSSAVTQLLALYDHHGAQDTLLGRGNPARRKSGRYNTSDTSFVGSGFRWPNEGLATPSHTKRPAYDDLSLAQWVTGQLSNIILFEDSTLLRNVLSQVEFFF